MRTAPPGNEFFSPSSLAEFLDVPLGTVYNWNSSGDGPRFLKVGRHVRYRRADVDAWLTAQAGPDRRAS